jgi:type IV pilus assembly protein PilO
MPKDSKFKKLKVPGAGWKDPRVVMRAIIGVLLLANLAAAIMAFKPLGGSADDMRNQQAALQKRLAEIEGRAALSKRIVDKVEVARRDGDRFLEKYVFDKATYSSGLTEELNRMANEAGIRPLPSTTNQELIEGSDTLYAITFQGGYEGTYANLKKFVELVDKSPRFLIIENMTLASPQQQAGQLVNVNVKLYAYARAAGATS